MPWWRHRRRRARPVLVIGNVAVLLSSKETIIMATTINVGQTLPLSIRFLDQNGQEMKATPDTPPQWSQNDSSIDLLTQSADGMTAAAQGTAAGNDIIGVQLAVAGRTFNARLDITVAAIVPVQTLTSIEIVPGTPSP